VSGARSTRVLSYSHDGYGLGHLRRTLALLSGLLEEAPGVSVLAATGSTAALRFPCPAAVDYLKLPALTKDDTGRYVADVLDIPVEQLFELRASLLEAAVGAFRPDLALIDHYPLGVHRELDRALRRLRRDDQARLVLGLRDILDDPVNVCNGWRAAGHLDAIPALFDHVLVYGDARIYDPVAEYGLDDVTAEKIIFTGYLVPERSRVPAEDVLAGRRRAVCTLGGGKDAPATAWAFVEAVNEHLASDWDGLLVTGPLMAPPDVARLRVTAAGTRVSVVEFLPDVASALATADVTVCMGGYNTMCDVLSVAAPTVVVPRVHPRSEQLIRARAFADREVVRVLHPDQMSPVSLGSAMLLEAARNRKDIYQAVTAGFAVDGLAVASRALAGMLPAAAKIAAAERVAS